MLPRFQLIALLLLTLLFSCKPKVDDNTTWRVYGGSKQSTRYSALTQIDTSNVTRLKMVWIHHTNDADTAAHSQIQCNPIIVNGTLYATTPRLRLIALDAKTGAQKWGFDPAENSLNKSKANFNMNNNRGVTYWEDGEDKRILYCAGSYLYEVNAETGKII